MELFSKGGQVIFLTFPSTSKRNLLYDRLVSLPDVKLEKMDLAEMTQKWQTGEVTNFDYLMFLNLLVCACYKCVSGCCVMVSHPVQNGWSEFLWYNAVSSNALGNSRLHQWINRYSGRWLYMLSSLYYCLQISKTLLYSVTSPNQLEHSTRTDWPSIKARWRHLLLHRYYLFRIVARSAILRWQATSILWRETWENGPGWDDSEMADWRSD